MATNPTPVECLTRARVNVLLYGTGAWLIGGAMKAGLDTCADAGG